MDSGQALEALGAIANEQRLALFRLLVQEGAEGLPAGSIATALKVPNSSLSFHLAHLTQAGLIRQARQGRSLVYSADYGTMNDLVAYLTENCCGGNSSCGPAAACESGASQRQSERETA
jgi:ArsR family transcriptional regulator, arsenate/arsenite/antimonite-responsive transcriptional repressor